MTTLAGGVRGAIVALGFVGERIYRDRAPDDALYPFMTFIDFLGDPVALAGDSRTLARRRTMQFSLWFADVESENDTLVNALRSGLDGLRATTDEHSFKVRVRNVTRPIPDPDGDVQVVFELDMAYIVSSAGPVVGTTNRPLYIKQGATFAFGFNWYRESVDAAGTRGVAYDLTGCTARMQIRARQGDPILVEATTENAKIVLGTTNGRVDITLSAADTDRLTVPTALYDLEVEFHTGPDAGRVERLLQGPVTVEPNITQTPPIGP